MSGKGQWNPVAMTLEQQIRDIAEGKRTVSDDTTVMKERVDGTVDIYWKSDSSKGHGHGHIDPDGRSQVDHY